MSKLALWEVLMLYVILRVMLSSKTRECYENNIDVCDYTTVNLNCICIVFGYFLGKIIFKL